MSKTSSARLCRAGTSRFSLLAALSFICTLFVSMPAGAQSSRLYFAGYMGLSSIPQQEYSDSATPVAGDVEFDNAVSFAAALGLRLSKKLRLEGEISYHKDGLDKIQTGGTQARLAGELKTYSFTANAYYDFDLDLNWPVQPFVTAGLGFAHFDGKIDDVANITSDESGDDLSFIWQVGSGLKYRLSRDTALTGGYRYQSASSIQIDQAEIDYSNHEFRIGLEYDIPVR